MKLINLLTALLLTPCLWAGDLVEAVLPGDTFGSDWEMSQASPFKHAVSPSYINRKLPNSPVVMVNIIECASPDAARQQWTKKFGTPEASKYVRKVEGVPDAFDTIPQPEMKDHPHLKRFMLIGRYWLTVEQIGSKDYREEFIEKYYTTVKNLAEQDGGDKPAAAGAPNPDGAQRSMQFEKYGFAVQTPKGWHMVGPKITKMFAAANHKGVVAHAALAAPNADKADVDSDLLTVVTKHPLGESEDNPNVTLSVEKSWTPGPENTGATYLKLLADRYKLLHAPSEMEGEPQKAEFGGLNFFTQYAVNNKVPGAPTRQQYMTAYMDGYYITFILSYNAKNDADYQAMVGMVESFTRRK